MPFQTRSASHFAAWLADNPESAADRAVSNPASLGVGLDMISFANGQPAAESYPLEALERAYSRAILESGLEVLPYGPTEGLLALRQIVVERLASRGIDTRADNVGILTGSLQGLHLVGRVTLDRGDTIVTEAPTFMGALATWEQQEPRYLTVPVDEHGMDVDKLEEALRTTQQRPRFIYLLPTFQNPSGVSMPLARRQQLLEVAEKHDLLIIEDDPYGDFWFDEAAARIPPLRSLPGAEKRVIYLGTFSKILAPGLRLGFVIAWPEMIQALLRAKRGVDLHTDGLLQQAVVNLARDEHFDLEAHIATGRKIYTIRRDTMLDALETTFGNELTWTRPGGGFFLWLDLPSDVSGQAMAEAAEEQGVAVFPGWVFYPNGDGGTNGVRLSYSNSRPERIREGINRLRRGIATVRG